MKGKVRGSFLLRIIAIGLLLSGLPACRFEKDYSDSSQHITLCFTLALCQGSQGPAKFGMIGDSWTDMVAGTSLIDSLRDYMINDYGFRIAGATLAGSRTDYVLSSALHLRVIDEAGPEIKYMLLSLGGNDWDYKLQGLRENAESEYNRVFSETKMNLSRIIESGNLHKINSWGGDPLIWIIHGYDYLNPDNILISDTVILDKMCRIYYQDQGFTDEEINKYFTTEAIDAYNERLKSFADENPYLEYIDLRGTLKGPPVADKTLMFDCIHPNPVGFSLIARNYVIGVDSITGGIR